MDDYTNSQDHQPILLTRSDTLPPCQELGPSSSSATTEIIDNSWSKDMTAAADDDKESISSAHDKRKWDQVVDESSQSNIHKVAMHDHSIQSHSPPSNDDEENEDSDDFSSFMNGKKPGRKPLADEDPSDDDDPKVKRKAQNRAAQRAFRERKERYVKELEIKLKQVQDTHTMATNHLFQENHQLRAIVYRLEAENVALKGIQLQHSSLPGKPVQEWTDALQQHQQHQQQLFTANEPLRSILPTSASIPTAVTADSLHVTASIYNHERSQILVPVSPFAPHPVNVVPSIATTPASNQQQQQQPQPQKYTFSVSTPATLRSRHKKQHRSSASPPLAPKPQRSPVELVRLYPHEQPTIEPANVSSPITITTTSHSSPPSSPSPISASTHVSSCPQTPKIYEDKLQEEGYSNGLDLLLSSESFFDTTIGESLDFSCTDEQDHPLLHQDRQASISPSSCSSSLFDTTHDYSSSQHPSATIAAAHEMWDRLDHRASFEHCSPDQLLKSMVNSTCVDPVLMEDCLQ
ncbi:hypothetical protein BCR42DRAFT_494262 [Absidia repens]|uniref:BZIP domain-containing protein n=1 Tax=Absidia repens TaxID=90262 RepID=A0A1X2I803_9FUNG|nr:hypothetical protein BCR42DRAFT_494262 [Absidia repens]